MNSNAIGTDRSRLDVETDTLKESIAVLHGMIGNLENHLQSVLEPAGPQPGIECAATRSGQSPTLFIDRVGWLNEDVIAASKRLDSLIGRLHV